MTRVDLVDGRLELTTDFRKKDLVKQIPGARWDRETRVWTTPLSWASVWQVKGIFDGDLEVSDTVKEWVRAEHTRRVEPALALREATDWDLPDQDRLYPFQRVGVAFLNTAGSAILADQMGLGKTVQALTAIENLPVLIVCPNSMKLTWAREAETWRPDLRVVVSHTSGQGVAVRRKSIAAVAGGDADVLIINWESLRTHTRLAPYGSIALTDTEKEQKELNEIEWGTIIADEAHRAKDPRSKQTRALWAIAHQQDCVRWALTGTPIANAPDDAWSLLHFIAPDEWPAKTRFIDRYCLTGWSPFGGLDVIGLRPDTRDEFFRIVDPRFLRRPKEAVLPDLPPKVHITRFVEMTPKQRKAYGGLVKEMLADLESGLSAVTDPLVRALRLMQLASSYAVEEDGRWRLTEPSSKLDDLMDLLGEVDGQAVIFAESRQLIQLLEQRLTRAEIPFGAVHGQVDETSRDRDVAAFQDGRLPLILVTLGAGGEGLTLSAASTVVFLQRSWSMVKNAQAEDRAHRIGQTKFLTVVNMVAAGTLEEYQLEGLAAKNARLEELVRDEEVLRRMLGDHT